MLAAVIDLACDLERVSYYGVGRSMGDLTDGEIPALAAVARRVAPDPHGRLRVSIALSVRQALARVDPPKRQAAMYKLLWLDPDDTSFADDTSRRRRPLKDRHPEVAPLLGFSLNTYERHKKWRPVYHEIAGLLLDLDQSATSTPTAMPDAGDADAPLSVLTALAATAADLHYAALTSLFVASFHNECTEDPTLDARRLYAWDDSAAWLCDCYCRLVATEFLIGHHDETGARRTDTKTVLGERALAFLYRLSSCTRGVSPFSEDGEAEGAAYRYGRILDYHEHRARDLRYEGDEISLGSLYEEQWMPWYRAQFTASQTEWPPATDTPLALPRLEPPAISFLTTSASRIVAVITDRIVLPRPVMTQARSKALRQISTFYDLDAMQPLGTGGSLKDRISYFFDATGGRLARLADVDYDDDSESEELIRQSVEIHMMWREHSKSGTGTMSTFSY